MPSKGSTAKGDNVLPRPGSAEYNFIMADEETARRSLKKWKRANRYFMVPLYRAYLLPLFGFGRIFLLLYTKDFFLSLLHQLSVSNCHDKRAIKYEKIL